MEIHRMEKVGVIYEPYMVRGGTTSIFLVNCTHLGVPVIFIWKKCQLNRPGL